MADLETALKTRVLSDGAIADLIGDRMSPLVLAQTDARPYLAYHITDGETEGTLDGEVDDYQKTEFEIAVYADEYDDVIDLVKLVKNRLDQCGETVSGVEFAPIWFVTQTDVEQTTPEGDEIPAFVRVLTFNTLYKITA